MRKLRRLIARSVGPVALVLALGIAGWWWDSRAHENWVVAEVLGRSVFLSSFRGVSYGDIYVDQDAGRFKLRAFGREHLPRGHTARMYQAGLDAAHVPQIAGLALRFDDPWFQWRLPLGYPLAACLGIAGVCGGRALMHRRRRLASPHACPACGYDLRGNPDAAACPECGETLAPIA